MRSHEEHCAGPLPRLRGEAREGAAARHGPTARTPSPASGGRGSSLRIRRLRTAATITASVRPPTRKQPKVDKTRDTAIIGIVPILRGDDITARSDRIFQNSKIPCYFPCSQGKWYFRGGCRSLNDWRRVHPWPCMTAPDGRQGAEFVGLEGCRAPIHRHRLRAAMIGKKYRGEEHPPRPDR